MIKRFFSKSGRSGELRDTDHDWAIIGETEPYFGVITADRFKRNQMDDQARSEFFQSGRDQIGHFLQRMRALFGAFEPKSALDFGCGVGRLTLPLAEITSAATGVDISPGMLAEARRHNAPGTQFVDKIPDEKFDWIVSIIVLQHIAPERGYEIIKALLGNVSPGGGATIQIMFARTNPHRKSFGSRIAITADDVRPTTGNLDHRHIPEGVMLMHDYDLSHVVALFYLYGMKNLFLEHCDHGGIVGATIYGRKDG